MKAQYVGILWMTYIEHLLFVRANLYVEEHKYNQCSISILNLIHHASIVMHPMHVSVQARPPRRSKPQNLSKNSNAQFMWTRHHSITNPQAPLTLVFASLCYAFKPSTSSVWVDGKNRFLYLELVIMY